MKNTAIIVFICLLTTSFYGCSETKEITVEQEATKPGKSSPAPTSELTPYKPDSVSILKIGEVGQFTQLDPLTISSNSMLRTASLIYEGLTEINANDEIIPAIARSWEVNEDSTRFTFYIDKSRTYHDSDAFLNGMGRSVSSSDVLFAFKRMGQPGVFPAAYNLFKHIRGFDAFYYQSHLPDYPNPSISGIQTPNDSTIHIHLLKPDADFLKKLAHPYASIYASESFDSENNSFKKPIGTGEYMFGNVISDSVLILQQAQKSDLHKQYNQLHIYYSTNERSLYKFFAKKRLHLLPEIGPATAEELLQINSEITSLKPTYSNLYRMQISSDGRIWEVTVPETITSGSMTDQALIEIQQYAENSVYYTLNEADFEFENETPEITSTSKESLFYIHSSSVNRINYLILKSELVKTENERFRITNQSYICNGVGLSLSEKNTFLYGTERMKSIGELITPVLTISHETNKAPTIETNAAPWWISISQPTR